jgi:hypothetical protein
MLKNYILQNVVHSFLHMLWLLKKPFHARWGRLGVVHSFLHVMTVEKSLPMQDEVDWESQYWKSPVDSYYKVSDSRHCTHTYSRERSTIFLQDSIVQWSSIQYFWQCIYTNMDMNGVLSETAYTLFPVESQSEFWSRVCNMHKKVLWP